MLISVVSGMVKFVASCNMAKDALACSALPCKAKNVLPATCEARPTLYSSAPN